MITDQISPVVIIVAGSFTGKSLIANHLANKYLFSGVLSTDMVRNMLCVQTNDRRIFSMSTYRMTAEDLNEQMCSVSNMMGSMIGIYRKRREKIIFEGMHFSESFLSSLNNKDCLLIALDNKLSIEDRLNLKKRTTRLGFSPKTEKDKRRIEEIHHELLNCCRKNNFHIIEFNDIKVAKRKCESLVEEYLLKLKKKSPRPVLGMGALSET
jgi:2-phosphoglycerate kinase